ncbi:hypothetical protein GCM10027217_06380 [Pseudomaricurvus hydrocarbonicus]
MAEVYLAIQQSFEREVALKVLAPNLTGDATFSERFLSEARIVSRLVHPNIVTVYDVGIEGEYHFLSMEYIPGLDLKQARYSLSLTRRLDVIKDIAGALHFAGKKGYIHRDVKPDNIMLHADDGRAVLMDFGIARPAGWPLGMTQTGTAIGTPHYMSPEQARGLEIDPRSDLYSLGVVLYLLLEGRVPYDADSAVAVGIKHVAEPVPRLRAELKLFQPIINKALAKDPDSRYQTGKAFIRALDDLPPGEIADLDLRYFQESTLLNSSKAVYVAARQETRIPGDEASDHDITEVGTPPSVSAIQRAVEARWDLSTADWASTTPASTIPASNSSSRAPTLTEPVDLSDTDSTPQVGMPSIYLSADDPYYEPVDDDWGDPRRPAAAGRGTAAYYDALPHHDRRATVSVVHQRHSAWPWVVGTLFAAGLAFAVYFQQQLPIEERLKAVDHLTDSLPDMLSPGTAVSPDTGGQASAGPSMSGTVNRDDVAGQGSPALGAAATPEREHNPAAHLEINSTGQAGLEAVAIVAEETRLQILEKVAGLLSRVPEDVSLAVPAASHYRKLLKMNASDNEAIQGLQLLHELLLDAAQAAYDGGDDQALESVAGVLGQLFPESEDVRLNQIVNQARREEDVARWLDEADQYMRTGAWVQSRAGTGKQTGAVVESGALAEPEPEVLPGSQTALAKYRQVLAVEPDNQLAREGVREMLSQLTHQAAQSVAAGQWESATQAIGEALVISPGDPQLIEFRTKIQQQRLIASMLNEAQQQHLENNIFEPANASELFILRQILAIDPANEEAMKAQNAIEDSLVSRVSELVSERRKEDARAEIARSLAYFPESERLLNLKKLNEREALNIGPTIGQVLVSHQELTGINQPKPAYLPASNQLYVGFSYENFGPTYSQVQARLFGGEGLEPVEVAEVSVDIPRNDGVQFFSIDSPAQGFLDGYYRVDLVLDGQVLATSVFEISHTFSLYPLNL